MQIDLTKNHLGPLCYLKHDYQNSGQSLRNNKSNRCWQCKYLYAKKWNEQHIESRKEKHKKWRQDNREYCNQRRTFNRKKNPFMNAKTRVKNRCHTSNLPFDLDEQYLRELWDKQNGKCYWTQLDIKHEVYVYALNKATIDRLDPSKGYIKNNVVWASRFANLGRGNAPIEEFLALLKELKNAQINPKSN